MSRNNSIIVIFAISMLIVAAIGTSIAISVTNNKDTPTPGPEPEPEPGVVTKEECVAVALASYEEAHANYVAALEKYENAGSATSKQECAVAVAAATAQMYSALSNTMKTLNDDNVLMNDLIGYQSNGTSIKGLYDEVYTHFDTVKETESNYATAKANGSFGGEGSDVSKALDNILAEMAKIEKELSAWTDSTLNGHLTDLQNVYDKYATSATKINSIFEQIKVEIDYSKKALDSNDINTVIQINNNIAGQLNEAITIASSMADLEAKFAELCGSATYKEGINIIGSIVDLCKGIDDTLVKYGCSDDERAVFTNLISGCATLNEDINDLVKEENEMNSVIFDSSKKIAFKAGICSEISKFSASINNDISKAVVPLDGSAAVIEANIVKLGVMSIAAEQAAEAASNATTVEEATEAAGTAYEMASQSDALSEEIVSEIQSLQSLVNDANASLGDAELEIEAMEALTETLSDAGKKAQAEDEKNTNVPAFDTLSGDDENVDNTQPEDLDDAYFDENGDGDVDENGVPLDENGNPIVDENGASDVDEDDVPVDENVVPLDENGVATDFCGYSEDGAEVCATF